MKLKRRSTWLTLGLLIFVVGILAVSTMLRAYAAPPILEDDVTIDDSAGISVIRDGGVYYILGEGVEEIGDCTSIVTDGCILFTFIREDGYASIGPFESSETLVGEVAKYCNYALRKKSKLISQDEAKVLIDIAAKIQSGDDGSIIDLKTGVARDEECEKWNIVKINNKCYYKNKKIKVLLDLGEDRSMRMKYDADGDVSIRLLRDESGAISKVEYLTDREVSEILKEYGIK